MNPEHSVEQFREEPVSDLLGGIAHHQDMLNGLDRVLAEDTSWAEIWLVNRLSLIGQEVRSKNLQVESLFLDILGCEDVPQRWK